MKNFSTARQFAHLENALQSLKDSTDYGIALCGETVEFRSRNAAPSRRLISVEPGHYVPGLIIADNGKYTLYIAGNGTELSGDIETVQVPSYHLDDLFAFPANKPAWINGLVTVGWPDEFSGFRQDGSPTFYNCGNVVVKYDDTGVLDQTRTFPFGEPVKHGFRLDNNWFELGDVVDYETSERLPDPFDCECQSPEEFTCPCGNDLHCPVDCPYRDKMEIIKGEDWETWNPDHDNSDDLVKIIRRAS